MVGDRVIVCVQPDREDVADPLMQEVVVRVIFKEEKQSVVEVYISKGLMDFFMMQTEYIC